MATSFPTASRLTSDATEELRTSGSGGGGGAVNITGINGVAPSLSNPLPVEFSDGTNPFGTAGNPINTKDAQGTPAANTAGWPVTSGGLAEATAAWTSATTVNTALQVNVAGFSSLVLTLNVSGSITGGTVIFEVSDTTAFTNAYAIVAIKSNAGITAGAPPLSQALSGLANTAYIFNVSGFAAFRLRLNPIIVGAGTLNVGITASAAPNAVVSPVSRVDGSIVSVQSSLGSTNPADNLASNSIVATSNSAAFPLSVADTVYGGAFSGTPNAALQGWSKARTPTVFKTAQINATSTTTASNPIWTPGAGNKFRLLKFQITAQGLAATATGVVTVSLVDGATGITIGTYDVDVPAVAGVVSGVTQVSGWVDLGQFGYLSLAANNVLNFGISAAGAGTVGTYRINVCGTEE